MQSVMAEARDVQFVEERDAAASHWSDNLVAGATASLVSKLVLQPLDIAKTLLQVISTFRLSICVTCSIEALGFVHCNLAHSQNASKYRRMEPRADSWDPLGCGWNCRV